MKIVKYSLWILVASICISSINIFAGSIPKVPSSRGIISILFDLPVGKVEETDLWIKSEDFIPQSYHFQKSMTTITNPCPNCKFKVALYDDTGASYGSIVGKTDDNFYFDGLLNDLSASIGVYYITVKRSDLTAVTSHHTGDWYITKQNSNAVYYNK